MPIETLDSGKKIRLVHPEGASVDVLLYGATVVSWKSKGPNDAEPVEHLFLSSKAALDGSKAVRGGIPVVFPFFGAPTKPAHSKLPQHGYARNSTWSWDGQAVIDNDAAVSIKLTLVPDLSLTQDEVELSYAITLAEHQLATDIHVTNKSTSTPLEFQALLHTYIRAPAANVVVDGLSGVTYTDKTQQGAKVVESRALVDVKKFTDSVYENGPGEYTVTWPDGGLKVRAIGFKDVVVWNPNAEAGSKMNDMEVGGWDRFICVEPGYVSQFLQLQPGQKWLGGQVLTPIIPSSLGNL